MLKIILLIFTLTLCLTLQAGRIWFDGSTDEFNTPPGKLLSDNADYWGEVILTGVDYTYNTAPDINKDNRPDRLKRKGRVLLNGNRGQGVSLSKGTPLQITFDFKKLYKFVEWDIITPSKKVEIKLEMRETRKSEWRTVFTRDLEDCPVKTFHRIVFPQPERGQFVRMTIRSSTLTQLREIIAWGDFAGKSKTEKISKIAQGSYPVGYAFPTITGIGKSVISDREMFYCLKALKPEHKKEDAVWSQVATWDSISNTPIAPRSKEVNLPLKFIMSRNESEVIALALTNTQVSKSRKVTVKLEKFRGKNGQPLASIKAEIGVLGTIGDRAFGNNLCPIFAINNLLGRDLMQKYLLNGKEIMNFPQLTLPPSGSAILWLKITTNKIKAGNYNSNLKIAGGQSIPVNVEVLDVELPKPFCHIRTYSRNVTHQFPFEYSDRMERDINYALDCGISHWRGGTERVKEMYRKIARKRGIKISENLGNTIPNKYIHNIYKGKWKKVNDLPKNAQETINASVKAIVKKAHAQGLDYSQWHGYIGDEPNSVNIEAFAAVCKMIKLANSKVNIYVNPCYWKGYDQGAVASDKVVAADLLNWYNKYVDFSIPLFLLLDNRPKSFKAFTAPRRVNAYYYVSGHLDRSESALEVQKYRKMAWYSFFNGFNGWGFYSYYSPRGNAWNHFDRNPPGEGGQEPSDYQMVYPGPLQVIPTRQSEALREGWEDWRLLTLLKKRGKNKPLAELKQAFIEGTPLTTLRLQALKAAARKE